MSLRRIAALLFALVTACARDVKPEATPGFVDYSVFDPAASAIPLPNDLVLAAAASLPDGAQKDLVLAFAAQGGFPSDSELPITVDFTRTPVGPGASAAPEIDPASIRPPGLENPSVVLFKITATGPVPAAYDTSAGAITLAQSGAKTTLQLRAPRAADGSRNWEAGAHYALAVRGGANGVLTLDGHEIHAMPTMFLLLAGKNLADPANQSLLPDPSAGAQLEEIRQGYLPVFNFVEAFFPSREIANLQTFQIAPGTVIRVEPAAGVVPLPFDLLRTDPDGTVIFNPAFGPAARGIDTLDGFSTTAMMLAPTSAPVDAATVTAANVFLFRLPAVGSPALVRDLAGALGAGTPAEAVYVTQPSTLNRTIDCGSATSCSDVIGLQPAVPVPVAGVALPPLEESTDYAVVITKGVKDTKGKPLARSTVAKILLDLSHTAAVGGVSQLIGIDDTTAVALDRMRDQLAPVYAVLPGGKTKADVAMAYTFRTQSITGAALQLSALPFAVEQGAAAAVFTPLAATTVDVTTTYGIPAGLIPDVDSFYSVSTPTLDAIDPTTGALRADLAHFGPTELAGLVKPLPALVAVPKYGNVPSCGLPAPNDALHCATVVVFEHGINGGHLQMIAVANTLAARGFVVAAVDFPLHGDRAYCSSAADCNAGGTCDLIPGGEGQGDALPPGICSNGNKLTTDGSLTSVASGRYFVTANFFRARDAFRQNLVDQSALALSVARPPSPFAPQPSANPLASALLAKGIAVDPSAVYLEGFSLGAIAGTDVLATNPRVTRGVLSVGGGTVTDVFLDPASVFKVQVDQLFQDSLGFDRNDPANAVRYLQTVNTVKWIVDPADPINFAKHVRTSPLPNLLSPTPALQAAKDAWGQVAQGDTVVLNKYNLLLFNDAAIPFTTYTLSGGDAPHSLLATFPKAQGNAADFLSNPAVLPPATVDLP